MREKLQVAIRSVFRVLVSPPFFFFKENLGSFSLLYYFCYYYLKFIYFWLHCVACRILVPQPGVEPMLSAEEVQGLNH